MTHNDTGTITNTCTYTDWHTYWHALTNWHYDMYTLTHILTLTRTLTHTHITTHWHILTHKSILTHKLKSTGTCILTHSETYWHTYWHTHSDTHKHNDPACLPVAMFYPVTIKDVYPTTPCGSRLTWDTTRRVPQTSYTITPWWNQSDAPFLVTSHKGSVTQLHLQQLDIYAWLSFVDWFNLKHP